MTDSVVNIMTNRVNSGHDDGPSDLAENPIQSISRFNILRVLGEGGMGKVYLAEDRQLHRKLVLKVLPKEIASNKILIERFKREARASAGLKHPNIVTVYDLNRYEAGHYIAMEYIDGIALSDLLEERELSVNKVIDIAIQVCRGLRSAHQAGIIHRDIKPANIMIDKEGWVKILDFGLAKLAGIRRLTKYGVRMGTIPYMAPEQLRGEDVDKRADIFSLGVVLYQLLTHRLPFKGETENQVMYSIAHGEPEPMARYKTGVTDGLQRIIDKALDKDRSMRYQHVDDLLSDLKREKKYSLSTGSRKQNSKQGRLEETIRIRTMDTENLGARPRQLVILASIFFFVAVLFLFYLKPQPVSWLESRVAHFIARTSQSIENQFGAPQIELASLLRSRGASPEILSLIRATESKLFQNQVRELAKQGKIAVGKTNINLSKLERCYIFIADNETVTDVFIVSERQFRSLRSRMTLSTLSGKYPDMRKIWVQDLRPRAGTR